MQNRRDFLKGTAWMGAAAVAAGGCASKLPLCGGGAPMQGWADKPIANLRVGIVGLGRGHAGVAGFSQIPGCTIVAVADPTPVRMERALKTIEKNGGAKPRCYTGLEDWKRMCEADDIDLIYNATPWQLHVPIALYAMEHGKHVVIEVPSAFTVEECWALVETSERTHKHCMQLENCCYGENEMLALNLVRLGKLGEVIHGEGAYIHDLRSMNYSEFLKGGYYDYWRLRHNVKHAGNAYPTHGMGPVCQYMNINRGDRFDWLVSVDSNQQSFELYGREMFPSDSWQAKQKVDMANMNTTVIKTALGRTIMVQHDVASPRPYSRLNLISGTRGILADYPLRIALEQKIGGGAHGFNDKVTQELRQQFKHPLWKTAGEIALKVGGHGGMDFLMVLRLAYCLQQGLPLDMDVYDLATWCSICELTETSARNRGRSMDVPDFTRGAWKTAKPLGIEDVDLKKMNFDAKKAKKDAGQMNV